MIKNNVNRKIHKIVYYLTLFNKMNVLNVNMNII